ncbi:HEPN domain-containing protein [Caballeronia sp. INSB1]|uniref:HEPN domain-containing protein n=1 Tax=Caballeronia sp. INSB1 TaxID=2921751 RepID=UPI0020326B8D|nr:HEPN domain-containing protein [Caballeronia sp. INSB1]
MKVELVTVHDSEVRLSSSASVILNVINADPSFVIEAKQLTYDKSFTCNYSCTDWFNVNGQSGMLHVFKFVSDEEVTEADCQNFAAMLKAFRTIMHELGKKTSIETLWDDVSFRYCKLAYPMILNTENQMRRLITQFMLKTLGATWIHTSAPKEVHEQLQKSKRGADGSNPLHEVDFDVLVDYLTKPYSSDTTESLHKRIKALNPETLEAANENIEQLKAMVPQSNWTRYFSKIVSCEDSFLRSKWNELYVLRCKIAHNTYLNELEYEKVKDLCGELDKIVTDAASKLGQVEVSEEAAVELATMATSVGETNTASEALHLLARYRAKSARFNSRDRLKMDFNSIRETLLAAMTLKGMALPEDTSLVQLQREALRQGLIDISESRHIDAARDAMSERSAELPVESVRAISKRLRLLNRDLVSRYHLGPTSFDDDDRKIDWEAALDAFMSADGNDDSVR